MKLPTRQFRSISISTNLLRGIARLFGRKKPESKDLMTAWVNSVPHQPWPSTPNTRLTIADYPSMPRMYFDAMLPDHLEEEFGDQ